MFSLLRIQNPKLNNGVHIDRTSWYPYYPGFSYGFAHKLITSAQLSPTSVVFDPWNGSGTTTDAAFALGFNAIGIDLNPVMAIVARARILMDQDRSLIRSITERIRSNPDYSYCQSTVCENEPLTAWFTPPSAAYIRNLESRIQALAGNSKPTRLASHNKVNSLSSVSAFYYVVLFKTLRRLLKRFIATNPTWIKKPIGARYRLRTQARHLFDIFLEELGAMVSTLDEYGNKGDDRGNVIDIRIGASDALELDDDSVDMILTSPPYCTRIDYAVATMPELALLGYLDDKSFRELRDQLIGSSTIAPIPLKTSQDWGPTCNEFLARITQHKSKSSGCYYLKNHIQYFNSIFNSIGELSRILVPEGLCVIVVQDSHYKEIHNDLARVITEMGINFGIGLERREDFPISRTMAEINPRIRRYRTKASAVESVLCFSKKRSNGRYPIKCSAKG